LIARASFILNDLGSAQLGFKTIADAFGAMLKKE